MEPIDEEFEVDLSKLVQIYKDTGMLISEKPEKSPQGVSAEESKEEPKAERKLYFGDIPIWRSFDSLAGHWIYYLVEKYSPYVVYIRVHLGYEAHVEYIRDNLHGTGMFSWDYLSKIQDLSEERLTKEI
jgi:hypothetical protein